MVNHHLLLKVSERISLGSALNRQCYLDFADEHATSAKMSLSKGHLWMGFHFKSYGGKLPGTPGFLNLFQNASSYF